MQEHSLEFTESETVGYPIVIDGRLFTHVGSIYYRCCKCHTGAIVRVDEEKNVICELISVKEHDDDCVEKFHKEKIEWMKNKKAIIDIFRNNPLLTNDDIIFDNRFSGLTRKQVSRFRKEMKERYELPKDINDIINIDSNTLKLGYEKGEMIILGQPSGLYALAQSEIILMDGTFKAVKNKGQLYIIHCYIGDMCISCIFAIMMKRSEESYVKLFKTIQLIGEMFNLNIFKRNVIVKSDFEIATIKSLNTICPDIKLSGCFFHYVYNIMKKIRTLGLYKLYQDNKVFKTMIQRIRYLCFVPLEFVTFKSLKLIYDTCENSIEKLANCEIIKSSKDIWRIHGWASLGHANLSLLYGMFVMLMFVLTIYVRVVIVFLTWILEIRR